MKYIFGSNLSDLCPLSLEVMFEVGNLLAQLHQSLKAGLLLFIIRHNSFVASMLKEDMCFYI